jgi:hypothetical protein
MPLPPHTSIGSAASRSSHEQQTAAWPTQGGLTREVEEERFASLSALHKQVYVREDVAMCWHDFPPAKVISKNGDVPILEAKSGLQQILYVLDILHELLCNSKRLSDASSSGTLHAACDSAPQCSNTCLAPCIPTTSTDERFSGKITIQSGLKAHCAAPLELGTRARVVAAYE